MQYRTTPLTVNELDQLRTLIESVRYRLSTSDGQHLTEAAVGEVLTEVNSVKLDLGKELAEIQRIRSILTLPLKSRGDLSPEPESPQEPVSLRETMDRQGLEHSTRRDKRTAAERASKDNARAQNRRRPAPALALACQSNPPKNRGSL